MPSITIKQSNNSSISNSFEGASKGEFIPKVDFNHSTYNIEKGDTLTIAKDKDKNDEMTEFSKYLDKGYRSSQILLLTTIQNKIKLPFTISEGRGKSIWHDDDGLIETKFSVEDPKIKLLSKKEVKTKFGSEIEVEIECTGSKSKEFYIKFYARDNEDDTWSTGELKDVYCGCFKVVYKTPNEWQFSKEKIEEIKIYAEDNNIKYNSPGDANRYHHCTDTHKHIIYKLLNNPTSLSLGKDQNHLPSANRITPNDFVKAGESTTHDVRNKTIAATFAEPSKTFTVIDINNNEVLTNSGKAGNTDNALKSFKESPIDYMKNKCPDNGYYVFIGAYNDDYHSFTIIVNKEDASFNFQFVDQIVGVKDYTENNFENSKLLDNISDYNFDYPMKLELYQLRNKKK